MVLELGGNAAVIVDGDQAPISTTRSSGIIFGAFYQSGQSCIGVQRILVHETIYDALRDMLVAKTKTLVTGDPKDEKTFIGPMISEAEAKRLDGWIEGASAGGAKIVVRRQARWRDARGHAARRRDARRPICIARRRSARSRSLERFDDFEAALDEVNDSDFGLQAGIFTRDLFAMRTRAWDALEVGGVVINDVPSFRVDNMPYGGVKDSGLGREGVRYAIEDMTEMRLMVMRETW